MTNITAGIRSDLHARTLLARHHAMQLDRGKFDMIFDLGDIEASYFDKDHWFRQGKSAPLDPMTLGKYDPPGRTIDEVMQYTLEAMESMKDFVDTLPKDKYVFLQGNAIDVWTRICRERAPGFSDRFLAKLKEFDNIRQAGSRVIGETGIIYLPWKADIGSVNAALGDLEQKDFKEVIILSHDYLTKGSLQPEWREGIRPLENEEQVVTTLDRVAGWGVPVSGYYGHIGFEYPLANTAFKHKSQTILTCHVDERYGSLIRVGL